MRNWLKLSSLFCSITFCGVTPFAENRLIDQQAAVWGLEQVKKSQHSYAQPIPLDGKHFSSPPIALFSNTKADKLFLIDSSNMAVVNIIALPQPIIDSAIRSSDHRFIYTLTEQGQVRRFDQQQNIFSAEVKVAIQSRSMALSHDNRYLLVGNAQPHSAIILDAETLRPLKYFAVNDGFGKTSSVYDIQTNAIRETFMLTLDDMLQAWEISYADQPTPGFAGWEHSYQEESGDLIKSKPFPVRRLILNHNLLKFRFNHDHISLVGSNRQGISQIVDFDIRRTLFTLQQKYLNVADGAIWSYKNRSVLLTGQKNSDQLHLIDLETGKNLKTIPGVAAVGKIVTHEKSDYAFVPLSFTPFTIQIFDKRTWNLGKSMTILTRSRPTNIQLSDDNEVLILQTASEICLFNYRKQKIIKIISMF